MEDTVNVDNPEIEVTPVEHLATVLHDKMEHLEPTEDGDWECLSERQREFYRLCVKRLLVERTVLTAAMAR